MVQHKSVHFHCHDGNVGKGAVQKFQEPEGMTTIDLKNVHGYEECQKENTPPIILINPIRKYIIKYLIITFFIIFATVTIFTIITPQNPVSRTFKNVFHIQSNSEPNISLSEITKLISMYTENIDRCITSGKVDDCCAIFAELYDGFTIEACNIDTIRSLLGNATKWDNDQTESFSINNNITLDDSDDADFIDSDTKISDMLKPVIEDDSLNLEGDDIAIILSNDKIIKKEKYLYKREIDLNFMQNQIETPQINFIGDKERKFKIVDSKTAQENIPNTIVTSTQCVPLTPHPSYHYDPNPRYAELLPINRNPYIMPPTFPYSMNPYFSIPPIPPTQYQYNPFYIPQNPIPTSIQATNPSGQFFICNPVPAPSTNHLTSIPGVEVRQSSGLSLQDLVDDVAEPHSNKTRSSDLCPSGKVLCGDELKCIKEFRVCDNRVDCKDGSDEVGCSCTDRVGPSRMCDGYYDCPNGEDEWNCFGCRKNTFSCDDWNDDRRVTCIPIEQRCDGIVQCRTGKDEDDCAILSENFGKTLPMYKISNSAGFLYKNYKGVWYPACSNSEIWAISACDKESGPNILSPITHMVPTHHNYEGQYINLINKEVDLVDSCIPGFAVYVQCPSPICGKRTMGKRPFRSEEDDDDSHEDSISRFRPRHQNNQSSKSLTSSLNESLSEILGVVGGSPSRPAAWPWVISMYRNGFFHCGGVVISESWILTAAHCVDKYAKYYFEIEAGILRRLSFSPMQQTRFVTRVLIHGAYDRAVLKNDLALIKIDTPLKFNRYVRPICLPSEHTAGRNYLEAPPPGTLCTAIGWGATFEHGPDPDHLREVELPVLKHCKYPDDESGQEICAGFVEGGKDACQGDSGGPFMCRNPNSPDQWYLAGIVSHGDGCARPNEPGVYTRVSLYIDWIFENIRSNLHLLNIPLLKCPGYECKATKKCIPRKNHCDKMVDCLLGDDERQCNPSKNPELFGQAMSRMILQHNSKSEVNKLSAAEDTTLGSTTLITTTTETPVASAVGVQDPISTFKIETSQTETGLFSTVFESFRSTLNTDENLFSNTEITTNNAITTESIIEDVTTDTNDKNLTSKEKYFRCSDMLQLIPYTRRCDKYIDCEDGTDEMNCTCVDYLHSFSNESICDGINDCADFSDEQGCGEMCGPNEFRCRVSSTCVEARKKCDSIPDCPHNEDEWDCFALTDANVLLLDEDLRPHLNTKGIVTFYQKGRQTWTPICFDENNEESEEESIASQICLMLGLNDYIVYRQTQVEEKPMQIINANGDLLGEKTEINDTKFCDGFYLRCADDTISGADLESVADITNDLFSMAWNVAVYADGEYKCTGILLTMKWVLTSVNCFHGITKAHSYYVTVLAGIGRSLLNIQGPHQQERLVVYSTIILYSDGVMLKVDKKFDFTRYVRPLSIPTIREISKISHHKCVAVGRGQNRMETVLLHMTNNCTSNSRCFKRISPIKENCEKFHWSGVIVCESKSALYPISIYQELLGSCGFTHSSPFTAISLYKTAINKIIEDPSDVIVFPPICDGFRCSLGNCIDTKKLCDGIEDCRSGEDEQEPMCSGLSFLKDEEKQCDSLSLKCNNGKCVRKSVYCDRNNDCGDYSDEPDICNCFNYLNSTQPDKVCDGIVNCEDKSDENPAICRCTEKLFKCNNECVPLEMVCDEEKDCSDGADEQNCISLRRVRKNESSVQGEVTIRTKGIWHSGCFSRNMTKEELTEICQNLGFSNSTGSYEKYPSEAVEKLSPSPISNRFDIVWLHFNPKLRLSLRTGRDGLIRFDETKKCPRLYIQCSLINN
nr:serine protease nudel-like [Onthophagus taurus]